MELDPAEDATQGFGGVEPTLGVRPSNARALPVIHDPWFMM